MSSNFKTTLTAGKFVTPHSLLFCLSSPCASARHRNILVDAEKVETQIGKRVNAAAFLTFVGRFSWQRVKIVWEPLKIGALDSGTSLANNTNPSPHVL